MRGERIACRCGKSLGATPRGMIRSHSKIVNTAGGGIRGVTCEWSHRPAAELAACNADNVRATALALRDLAAQQQPHTTMIGNLTAGDVHDLCVAFLGGRT